MPGQGTDSTGSPATDSNPAEPNRGNGWLLGLVLVHAAAGLGLTVLTVSLARQALAAGNRVTVAQTSTVMVMQLGVLGLIQAQAVLLGLAAAIGPWGPWDRLALLTIGLTVLETESAFLDGPPWGLAIGVALWTLVGVRIVGAFRCRIVREIAPEGEWSACRPLTTERIQTALTSIVVLTLGALVVLESRGRGFSALQTLGTIGVGLLGLVVAVVALGEFRWCAWTRSTDGKRRRGSLTISGLLAFTTGAALVFAAERDLILMGLTRGPTIMLVVISGLIAGVSSPCVWAELDADHHARRRVLVLAATAFIAGVFHAVVLTVVTSLEDRIFLGLLMAYPVVLLVSLAVVRQAGWHLVRETRNGPRMK